MSRGGQPVRGQSYISLLYYRKEPYHTVAIGNPERHVCKASHCGSKQQEQQEFTCHDHSSRTLLLRSIVDIVSITRDYTPRSLYYCLFGPHICRVLFFRHIPFVVNHTFNATPPERLQQYT